MGIENLNNNTSEQESYAEELVQEKLTEIVEEIKTKFTSDPQHDVNKHWAAAVYRASLAIGKSEVDNVLAKNGWDENTFPQELL